MASVTNAGNIGFGPHRGPDLLDSGGGVTAERDYIWSQVGLCVARGGSHRIYIESENTPGYVRVAVSEAPLGQAIIVDVKQNLTVSLAGPVTIPAGSFTAVVPTLGLTLAAEDHLTVTVQQVGSTFPGRDLTVHVISDGTAGATAAVAPTTGIIVPYGSAGWKYLQTSADGVNRSAVNYDTSTWATGTAGFGTGPGGAFYVSNTNWSINTDLWIRRSIVAGAGSYTVRCRIDNDAILYWNGTQFATGSGGNTSEAAATIGPFAVPSALVSSTGPQVLAVRGHDYGGIAYLDAEVTAI